MKIEIKCVACPRIVRTNGLTIFPHTVMEHRYSPGETVRVCAICAKNAEYLKLKYKCVSIEKCPGLQTGKLQSYS